MAGGGGSGSSGGGGGGGGNGGCAGNCVKHEPHSPLQLSKKSSVFIRHLNVIIFFLVFFLSLFLVVSFFLLLLFFVVVLPSIKFIKKFYRNFCLVLFCFLNCGVIILPELNAF